MSRMTDFTVPSTVPGRTLHAFCCEPEGEVRAVLQLSHGMVEFIDRYKPLAEYLAGQGIVVVGHDHLGHGGSIRTKADYGYFAEPDGNRAVLDDLHAMTLRTKERYPGVPYFLLGHSMGSFYARQYLCEYGQELSGAIIMGTGHQPKALVQFARSTCRALAAVHGWQYRSKLVANLSFMGYNKGLEGRTTHDWLNRDAAEVDKYHFCAFQSRCPAHRAAAFLRSATRNFNAYQDYFSSATIAHISLCILRKILLRFFAVCQLSACFRNLIDSAARKWYIMNRVYCSVLSPYRYNLLYLLCAERKERII